MPSEGDHAVSRPCPNSVAPVVVPTRQEGRSVRFHRETRYRTEGCISSHENMMIPKGDRSDHGIDHRKRNPSTAKAGPQLCGRYTSVLVERHDVTPSNQLNRFLQVGATDEMGSVQVLSQGWGGDVDRLPLLVEQPRLRERTLVTSQQVNQE